MADERATLTGILHNRTAFGVRAPVLVRHVCYRDRRDRASANGPLEASTDAVAITRMNAFIANLNEAIFFIQKKCGFEVVQLFEFLSEKNVTHDAGKEKPVSAKETKVKTVRTLLIMLKNLPGALGTWRARLRIDVHAEYYSATYIFDQPYVAVAHSTPEAPPPSAQRIADIERTLSTAPLPSGDYDKTINDLYNHLWDAVESFFTGAPWPGECFAEFRGTGLRNFSQRGSPPQTDPQTSANSIEPIVSVISHQGKAVPRHVRQSLLDWLNRNAAFVATLLQTDKLNKDLDHDVNCVLCGMLDGNAVYGSSLGQPQHKLEQSRENPKQSQNELGQSKEKPGQSQNMKDPPLHYFVIHDNDVQDTQAKYQLGRLLRRLHVLGELRTAALLDFEQLHNAGIKIRALGNMIVEALPRGGNSPFTLSDDDLAKVHENLSEIEYPGIAGGLVYRISRSQYYAAAFDARIDDLRIQRLEGWEQYDEFIRRNLYQALNFVDGIGSRYQSLAVRIHRLTLANFQVKMAKFVEELRDINRTGELIAFAAFGYYLGHIISTFLLYFRIDHKLEGAELEAAKRSFEFYAFSFSFLLGAAILGLIHYRRKRKERDDKARRLIRKP